LTEENTRTPEMRAQLKAWFHRRALSRLLPGGWIIMLNSAVHPEDLLHDLENDVGWPTVRMDAFGVVFFTNTTFGNEGEPGADLIEQSSVGSEACVLTKTKAEPDPDKRVLFPARFGIKRLEEIQSKTLPVIFSQNYRSICRDDSTAMCKEEYIQRCQDIGRQIGLFEPCLGKTTDGHRANGEYVFTGQNPVFHGVDLAVKKGEKHDYVALVTIELVDFLQFNLRGVRVLLDAEFGQWSGPDIVRRIISRYDRYGGIVVVEDNGAQAYIRQFTLEQRTDMPVRPYVTTATKHHREYGVPGIFLEMSQGAWAIPNRSPVLMSRGVAKFVQGCLDYMPSEHTSDLLMAAFFAREQAKKFQFALAKGKQRGSLGMALLAR
jgi:hypothetical protein